MEREASVNVFVTPKVVMETEKVVLLNDFDTQLVASEDRSQRILVRMFRHVRNP